jgi:divalent metal cation (Fe/Co/Zn/Cd) transporter
VLLGLIFSLKSNNRDKDTGIRLYRIESFAAFIAAIAMVGMGIVIVVRALEVLMDPIEITHPETAIVTLACASVISGYRAYQMNKVAGKYNLISLKAGAKISYYNKRVISSTLGASMTYYTSFIKISARVNK